MSVKFTSKGLADGTDDTKELEFNVTGVTTGTTRTITVPDRDVTLGNAGDLTGTLPAIDGSALTSFTASQMPAGSVVQVVQGINTTQIAWSDGSQQTAVTMNITVQAGSLVEINFTAMLANTAVTTAAWSDMGFIYLYQNGGNIRQYEHDGDNLTHATYRVFNVAGSHLTGALAAGTYTFNIEFDPYAAQAWVLNRGRSSNIILKEIVQ